MLNIIEIIALILCHVVFKKWSMLGVRLSSYGCTREVGRAREKRLSGTRRSRVLL